MPVRFEDFHSAAERTHEYENYMSALCPFHPDNNPSLLIFKDGWFRCLRCNTNGSHQMLWDKLHGGTTIMHREHRTEWVGPKVHPSDAEEVAYQSHLDLVQFPSFGWYLEMRGISSMIEPCELGYYEGWYTVPVRNIDGRFMMIVYRAAPHVHEVSGVKYWCKGQPTMYVPNWMLLRKHEYLVVVFGIFDAITLSMLRHPVATSTHGKDSFKAEWVEPFRKHVYIIPDEGEYDTAMRLAKKLGWRGNVIRIDYPSGMNDPASFAQEGKLDDLSAILASNIKQVRT